MSRFLKSFLFVSLCGIGLCAWAGEKPWVEVRSGHFRVISDGDQESVYAIAREFEQMRGVFAAGAQNMRLDSGTPMLVVAPRDLTSMGRISSWDDPPKMSSIAGYFHHGWEKTFAVVRLDQDRPGLYQPVYHEYIHSLLHRNFRWLPTWLDEGMAELYGTSEFKPTSALVGVPSLRKYLITDQNVIPLKTLFKVNPSSPYYFHGGDTQLFYAESWALTHFLTFGPGMEEGKRLSQFYNLLQTGMDQEKAFEQVFGPISDVQEALSKYARKGRMQAWEIKNLPRIYPGTLRTLSEAETEAELSGFSLWVTRDIPRARALIEKALKDDPKLALAHENMGFVDFADGKDEDAAREFTAALAFDPTKYLSSFYSTMLSPEAKSSTPAEETQFESALSKTLHLNPQFAPAYVQLSLLYAKQGDLRKAVVTAKKALQFEPSRAGYLLWIGDLLLDMKDGKDSAAIARYVAERWQGADHNEAIELWNKVPREQRPADLLAADKQLDDVQTLEGTVSSVSCKNNDKNKSLALTVELSGKELTFHEDTKGAKLGFSDILWYGEDHFTPCQHIDGLRVILRYKPTSDKSYAGDFNDLQLRVDPLIARPVTYEDRQAKR